MPTFLGDDWSAALRYNLDTHIRPRFQDRPVTYLELGIYEARSACYALDTLLTHPKSHYIGLDPWFWTGIEIPAGVEQRARENLAAYGDKATIIKGDVLELCRQVQPVKCFDVIYIDGGHHEYECLLDSCVCWRLLKPEGIMFWDDVGGYEGRTDWPGVGAALRSFLQAHNGQWRWLFHNHQAGIVKNG